MDPTRMVEDDEVSPQGCQLDLSHQEKLGGEGTWFVHDIHVDTTSYRQQ